MTRSLTLWIARIRGRVNTVPGSSILETVVSLTILLTIMTLSYTYIDRINHSVNPQVLYKAHLTTNEVIIRDDLLIEDAGEFEIDGFQVKKSIEPKGKEIYKIEIRIYNSSGKLLYTRKMIKSPGVDL